MTIVGTRPEIIRLSATIKRLDAEADHVLVHTGQNHDYELNEVFFEDLGLRRPDHFLEADTASLGSLLGSVLAKTEAVIEKEAPDAVLVLGDTNSCIAAVMAKRLRVPVFHMEAGNRSFDENVPEETNRRMIDHVADYNLAYTEHARRNLLAEGLHPSRIIVTGSPMREVLDANRDAIEASDVLERQKLTADGYYLVSAHREENVDDPERLDALLGTLGALAQTSGVPVLVSTHPRTRQRLEARGSLPAGVVFHAPFGFLDYVHLQIRARAVLSDSGTISEESSILGFPAVSLREAIERPEALDSGATITTGVTRDRVLSGVEAAVAQFRAEGPASLPAGYEITDTSRRVVNFIRSTSASHHERAGIRRRPGT
jgi:UDP-N-acetylglucosamine 2-epimerase (non-hydrolysing)